MKRYLLTILLSLWCVCAWAAGSVTVRGRVLCGGRGVEGVWVSDGEEFARTDKRGNYSLEAGADNRFVFVCVPAGYDAPVEKGVVRYFHPLPAEGKSCDFTLLRRAGDDSRYGFIAIADPQIWAPKEFAKLAAAGLLDESDLAPLRKLPADKCDYGGIYALIPQLVRKAAKNFKAQADSRAKADFDDFVNENAGWLESYALFSALKKKFGGKPWYEWPKECRTMKSARAQKLSEEDLGEIFSVKFGQWAFFRQYEDFRRRAADAGVKIFGDLPIFVSLDSVEVWERPEIFDMKPDGTPANVAGVPPDYFSATGQLWGNPLYAWRKSKEKVYKFWFERVSAALKMFDVIRFDHFRGFADYWSIPASAKDAREGVMKKGPGREFFDALKRRFPKGKFVAEDLGLLSKAAYALRDELNIPAMAVLQFAFGDTPDNPYLPHNIKRECVYYTGTHDNNTSIGWYENAPEKQKDMFRRYFRTSGDSPNWEMIHAVMMSVAKIAIFPMQDIAGLGSECRTNTPGVPYGNWQWRLTRGLLERVERVNVPYLREIVELSGRLRESDPKKCVEI